MSQRRFYVTIGCFSSEGSVLHTTARTKVDVASLLPSLIRDLLSKD